MSYFAVRNGAFARKDKKILHNINIELHEGEVLSILGCNGAGKTTLMKCMMGLLQWSSGESLLVGKNLKSCKNIWESISYVAQSRGVVFDIKVVDMVMLGCNPFVKLRPKDEHLKLVYEALCNLGLEHLAQRKIASLSGGELQMVVFARALVKKPKILFLDEVESHLDFANQKIILECVKGLSQGGCVIVFNTHFPAHALYLSHKALLLNKLEHMSMRTSNAIYGDCEKVLTVENLSKLYKVDLDIQSKAREREYVLRI